MHFTNKFFIDKKRLINSFNFLTPNELKKKTTSSQKLGNKGWDLISKGVDNSERELLRNFQLAAKEYSNAWEHKNFAHDDQKVKKSPSGSDHQMEIVSKPNTSEINYCGAELYRIARSILTFRENLKLPDSEKNHVLYEVQFYDTNGCEPGYMLYDDLKIRTIASFTEKILGLLKTKVTNKTDKDLYNKNIDGLHQVLFSSGLKKGEKKPDTLKRILSEKSFVETLMILIMNLKELNSSDKLWISVINKMDYFEMKLCMLIYYMSLLSLEIKKTRKEIRKNEKDTGELIKSGSPNTLLKEKEDALKSLVEREEIIKFRSYEIIMGALKITNIPGLDKTNVQKVLSDIHDVK